MRAALRVVPPLFIEEAERSLTFRKDRRPEETPPPESGSLDARSFE
jgi:hypothetical protein